MRRNAKRMLTDSEVLVVFDMWESGSTRAEIAFAMDLTVCTLDERRKDQLSHLPKRQGRRESSRPIPENPSADQIAELEHRKAFIQSRWTAEQRVQRLQGVPDTTQHIREIAAAFRNR